MTKASPAKPICFVISPIDEEGSAIRRRSDQLLKHIIRHVLEVAPFEFNVTRADEIQKPGLITKQVIELAIQAPLVVADLTGYNPNVLYELAIRHYARKPVIHMIKVGERIPFDIADQRTIYYDVEIGAAEEARHQLAEQVQAVLADAGAVDNPVSVAMEVLEYRTSRNPVEQGIARVLQEVSAIRALVTPAVSTGGPQNARFGPLVGQGLFNTSPYGPFIPPKFEGLLGSALGTTLCANCGQPIGGLTTVFRSSDGKPIHPPGQCPPSLTVDDR